MLIKVSIAQTKKRTVLAESKIGSITCQYHEIIDLEKGDTIYFIYLGFQNAKFTTITDIKSIGIFTKEEQTNLIKDLNAALLEIGNKTSMSWDRGPYSINLYDFSNQLYLQQGKTKGSGYTLLTSKNVQQLIDWLGAITLGKPLE